MTDKQVLYEYRRKQSKETIEDAEKMLEQEISPRSVINRAYYALFYSVLSLLVKSDSAVQTSKHSGIIGLFDREFIIPGKIDKKYSKILHELFDERLEFDYKELTQVNIQDAEESVKKAKDFIGHIEKYIQENL